MEHNESPTPHEASAARNVEEDMRKPSLRQLSIAGAALAVVALVAGCTTSGRDNIHPAPPSTTAIELPVPKGSVDLLAGTWQYMPGASKSGNLLTISRTGESILGFPDDTQPDYATASYTANPPVNTYGTHLYMKRPSEVSVTAKLADLHGKATLSLMASPSIRYDERLAHQPGVDVTLDGATATITQWTSADEAPTMTNVTLPKASSRPTIAITQHDAKLDVAIDGTTTELAAQPFKNEVWFGMDTSDSFTVTSLTAAPQAGNEITAVDTAKSDSFEPHAQTSDGLVGLAKQAGHGDKLFGTAVDLPVLMSNPEYAKFVVSNSNEIEPEMLAKFQALQPEKGKYQFQELDGLVKFANDHHLTVNGHTLVFNEALPKWLTDELQTATPAQARQLMVDHITTVVRRYDGKHGHGTIDYWDVVNEPFDPDNFGQINKNNEWYKTVGPSYIVDALQAAHAANPAAKLGINEFAAETDEDQWNGIKSLVDSLVASKVPLDYIGFQAHFDEETLNDSDAMDQIYGGTLAARLQYLASKNIKARFSEVSVAENGNPTAKAAVYARLATICLKAPNCIGMNMWGLTNNTEQPFYFTADSTDPGDDAPTTQIGPKPVVPGSAWKSILGAVSKR